MRVSAQISKGASQLLMNDQYKYFEQHLTPSIAQELIQELFAGQPLKNKKS